MPKTVLSRPAIALTTALAANAALYAGGAQAQELITPSNNPYYKEGQATLEARKAVKPNKRRAKNVILFVADGMDPTTVAAARIFDGQSRGEEGEENFLSFERMPHIAMSKTYTTNAQTPDSAGTMSAMVTGVKTKSGVLSISDEAGFNDCKGGLAAAVPTLVELSEQAGLATGIVSTARLTHATPAALYAHSPSRNWETDGALTPQAVKQGCKDIARQFIAFDHGDGIEIALGGGRRNFLPAEEVDPENNAIKGKRKDGRDLTKEWAAKSSHHEYVFDKAGLDALDLKAKPKVLGLFEPSHMKYEADRLTDKAGEPSLAEMTETAITLLSQDRDGYFLMVEAGRVDHAHHAGNAARALKDVQAYSEAVAKALAMTNAKDTLIVVTADHGHTIAFQGYPSKGNNILGLADSVYDVSGYKNALDKKPYTTLVYANGPGSVFSGNKAKNARPGPNENETADVNYKQQALIPLFSETHGGQDVTIYASGPHAYLFGGVVEQNYIFHVIEAALRLNKRAAQ